MKPEDLTQMANQISEFFQSYPTDQAVEQIAQHIQDFWDPRMRSALSAIVADEKSNLTDLARKGAEKLIAG